MRHEKRISCYYVAALGSVIDLGLGLGVRVRVRRVPQPWGIRLGFTTCKTLVVVLLVCCGLLMPLPLFPCAKTCFIR